MRRPMKRGVRTPTEAVALAAPVGMLGHATGTRADVGMTGKKPPRPPAGTKPPESQSRCTCMCMGHLWMMEAEAPPLAYLVGLLGRTQVRESCATHVGTPLVFYTATGVLA